MGRPTDGDAMACIKNSSTTCFCVCVCVLTEDKTLCWVFDVTKTISISRWLVALHWCCNWILSLLNQPKKKAAFTEHAFTEIEERHRTKCCPVTASDKSGTENPLLFQNGRSSCCSQRQKIKEPFLLCLFKWKSQTVQMVTTGPTTFSLSLTNLPQS